MAKKHPAKNNIIFACAILALIAFVGCETGSAKEQTAGASPDNSANNDLKTEATKIILAGLSNSNPQVRINTIEMAAATNNPQFMPGVQQMTRDELVPVRFAAVVAIGDTKYSAAKNDVAQLLKDSDENVRLAADYALAMLGGSKSYTQQIRAALTSSNQQARANAAFLLGKIRDKEALPLLYNALHDEASDDKVRLNAIEAIARLGDEKIYQKLWAMLISAYADDRVFGIRAMGALGTSQAKDSILTMLKDEVPEVRLVAAEQLGYLDDTTGEKIVANAITHDIPAATDQETKARIQTLAAMAIGQINTPNLKKFLPELLKSDSQFARISAAKAVFQCAQKNNIGRKNEY
jgi:HEAT repeat protein